MGSGFENLILFGLLSLMLLIGTLLRAKVKLFQDYLVPASIIGGLIGFAIVSTGWLKIGEWQITSSSFNSVSYTHLDVYKRQGIADEIVKRTQAPARRFLCDEVPDLAFELLEVVQ